MRPEAIPLRMNSSETPSFLAISFIRGDTSPLRACSMMVLMRYRLDYLHHAFNDCRRRLGLTRSLEPYGPADGLDGDPVLLRQADQVVVLGLPLADAVALGYLDPDVPELRADGDDARLHLVAPVLVHAHPDGGCALEDQPRHAVGLPRAADAGQQIPGATLLHDDLGDVRIPGPLGHQEVDDRA